MLLHDSMTSCAKKITLYFFLHAYTWRSTVNFDILVFTSKALTNTDGKAVLPLPLYLQGLEAALLLDYNCAK